MVKNTNGFSLMEIIVGVALISVIMLAGFSVTHRALIAQGEESKVIRAELLSEEGVSAVRLMRDTLWANVGALTPGVRYGLVFDGAGWTSSTGAREMIGGIYDRYFTVENVRRNASGAIVQSGGTEDTEFRKFTITVQWKGAMGTTTRQQSVYLGALF